MKNYLIYYLFITLSIFLNSCTEGFKEEYSKLFIALTEVTAITTPTTDTTPDYTFSSTESGALTYGGSCSSSTTIATTGIGGMTVTASDKHARRNQPLFRNHYVFDALSPVAKTVKAIPWFTQFASKLSISTFDAASCGSVLRVAFT